VQRGFWLRDKNATQSLQYKGSENKNLVTFKLFQEERIKK